MDSFLCFCLRLIWRCYIISYTFFVIILQVWHIQSFNCLWSFGRNIFSAYFWKLGLLCFLVHKSKDFELRFNLRVYLFIVIFLIRSYGYIFDTPVFCCKGHLAPSSTDSGSSGNIIIDFYWVSVIPAVFWLSWFTIVLAVLS